MTESERAKAANMLINCVDWPYEGHPGCDLCADVVIWCRSLAAAGIPFRVLLSEVSIRVGDEAPDIIGACPP